MPITVYPDEKANFGSGASPGTTTVSNSSTEIVAANVSRRWCILTNVGNKDVYLAAGQTAEVDKGAILHANGGSIVFGVNFDTTQALNGITKASTSAVIFLEGA